MNGFIFFCSLATENECFKKGLFGGKGSFQNQTGPIHEGDVLYLYNFNTKLLYGIYQASSEGEMNIDPTAWNGQFPWQVRVHPILEAEPVHRRDVEHILPSENKFFNPKLTQDQMTQLLQLFHTSKAIPEIEVPFRQKFPPTKHTFDNHIVRSLGERIIDDWLFHQGIPHIYERKLPIEENMYCDFCIPIKKTKRYVYIEYWGLEDEEYQKRREQKQQLYKKYNLQLIELIPKDLENLDDVLCTKLRPFMPEGYQFL